MESTGNSKSIPRLHRARGQQDLGSIARLLAPDLECKATSRAAWVAPAWRSIEENVHG